MALINEDEAENKEEHSRCNRSASAAASGPIRARLVISLISESTCSHSRSLKRDVAPVPHHRLNYLLHVLRKLSLFPKRLLGLATIASVTAIAWCRVQPFRQARDGPCLLDTLSRFDDAAERSG